MGKLDALYARLPVWAQHCAATGYGLQWYWLRFGPGYTRYVREYQERERFSQQEWQAWQRTQLADLLRVAVTEVPYYRDNWSVGQKLAASDGELQSLPLLEKHPVRVDPRAFLRQDVRVRRPQIFHTSGSTGTPIATYWTVDELRRSLALREVRSARWARTSFRLPRATISGRLVEPDPESQGPYYRFNAVERQVYFSPFHIRMDTAAAYVDALARHNVQWLTGYAVSYFLLARFILQQGISTPPLRAVVTTSEKLTPEMRTVMEAAYGCCIFEEYSTVENAIFASQCEHGRLHVSPDVAIVEILDDDGRPCAPNTPGEVVVTCFSRTYQPLIRYRLGDLAAWDPDPCPCGREMPVLKEVVGRIEDVVVGPDGREMVRFHGIFVDQPHVLEGQIVQEALDRIRVKVVPSGVFTTADSDDIVERVQQRLGPEVRVIVEPVEMIPRTSSGKFQAVVSEIRGV